MAVAVSLRVTQAVPARQAIPENAGGALLQRDRDGGSPSLLAETLEYRPPPSTAVSRSGASKWGRRWPI